MLQGVHEIPAGAVAVSAKEREALMESQAEGKALIVRDGTVLAVEPEEMLIHEQ